MGLGVSHEASAQGGVSAARKPQGKQSQKGEITGTAPEKIRGKSRERYDLARLERAVAELVETQERLVAHVEVLENELGERDERIAGLDRSVQESDLLREKATAHIDQLIDQLDELEGRIESAESGVSAVQPGDS